MEILLTITGLFIAIIALPWFRHEILDDMALWAYLIYCGLPALNLVALALTFRKEKENTPPGPFRPLGSYAFIFNPVLWEGFFSPLHCSGLHL